MNQQVYSLARQADALAREIEPDLREIVRYNRIRDEKFAELIVRECAILIDAEEIQSSYGSMLKEHFGVQ